MFNHTYELLWVKLEITRSRPLFIGAFYRAREDDLESLQELKNTVDHSDNIWVLGDFNLPKLQWLDCKPVVKPDSYNNDNNLTQVVTKPNRLNNILDLFLTTTQV